ncbi:hypothetical protein SteCoe_34636 [Stentor coeruleus]|uniref:TmcB/TmcC TPR repeats domain-containing protein n=1 Tax=Stentor coeruleus TaxID=5963 RepID=A0A1R2AUB2_9CILI|nr:hypothetical protein SteCoe_34636 [Stentor coeruleus]
MKVEDIYRIMHTIFKEDSSFLPSVRAQKVYVAINSILIIGQYINFLWAPNMPMYRWSSFTKFWLYISLTSIDNLAAEFSFLFGLLILTISMISFSFIMLVFMFLAECHQRKLPHWIKKTTKITMTFICEIYFIPCCNILFLLSKYSTLPDTPISEYLNNKTLTYFHLGLWGKTLSIIFLILHLGLSILREAFTLEPKHSLTNIDLSAKISSKIDLQAKILTFIASGLFIYTQIDNYSIVLITSILFYGYLAIKYLYTQPYYAEYLNFFKVLIYFESFCVGIFFAVGLYLNSSTGVIILTVFVQPGIVVLSKASILYRLKWIGNPIEEVFKENFELAAREWFRNPNKAKNVIKYTNIYYEVFKDKMILVCQANYCADILNNSAVAAIKICQTDFQGFDVFTNYQVYNLQEKYKNENLGTSEGVKLCIFLLKFDVAKYEEKCFCLLYEKLINNLIRKKVDISTLRKLLKDFDYSLHKLISDYKGLVEQFPNSRIINKVFTSFLVEIANNPEMAGTYLNRIKLNTTKKRTNEVGMDFFSDPNSLVMVVSGNKHTIGKILYISPNLCNYLEITNEEIKDHWLSDFIPKCFSDFHNDKLYKFVKESLNQYTLKSTPLLLTSSKEFLLESYIYTECVGFDSSVNFVIVVDPMNKNKSELALLDDNNCILQHSKKFPSCFGLSLYKIDNTFLSDYISESDYNTLFTDKMVFFSKDQHKTKKTSNTLLVLENLQVFSKTLKIVKVIKNSSEKLKKIKDLNPTFDNQDLEIASNNTTSTFKMREKFVAEEKFYESFCNRSLCERSKRNAVSSSSSEHKCKNFLLLQRIDRDYKFVRIFFILSMIGMILVNIITSSYVYKSTNDLINLDSFTHMADIYTSFALLGLYVRSVDLNFYYNTPFFISLPNITLIGENLGNFQNHLRVDQNQWSFCPSSNVINDKFVSIWKFSKKSEVEFTSLMDLIDVTISHSKSFYEKALLNMTEEYLEDLHFLLFNTFRVSLTMLRDTFDGMILCEISKSDTIWVFSLTMFGICSLFLGCFLFGLCISILMFAKKEILLWKCLFKNGKESYGIIQGALRNRLVNLHKDKGKNVYENALEKNDAKIQPSWRYFLAVCGFGLLILVFFIVYFQWFFTKNLELLHFRMDILDIMVNRRVKLAQSVFFTEEIFVESKGNILSSKFFNNTYFPSEKKAIERISNEMNGLMTIFNSETFRETVPEEVFNILYKEYNSSLPVLKKGIWNAFSVIRRTNFYITGNSNNIPYMFMKDYLNDVYAILKSFEDIIPQTDKAVKEKIMSNILNFIIFSILWSLLELSYGIFIYKTLFKHDKDCIKCIETLLYIIPGENTNTSKSTKIK